MEQNSISKPRKRYRYSAFGLQIDSDIQFPELLQGRAGAPDVSILWGTVPGKIDMPLKEYHYYQASEREFLFWVEGVGRYYVKNGDTIVVQPGGHTDLRESRLYLLGTVMGVLLMQRGLVPVHGSTVVINGCGVIFTGLSGAGKSTVAAALHKKGYALLADDVSAVAFDEHGIPWVQPGYPQQKLWPVSASMIGINTTTLERVSADTNKYAVPVSAGFGRQPIPVIAVYKLEVQGCDDIMLVPLNGIEKLTAIMNNTYRVELINGLGLRTVHFQKCVKLVKSTQVFCLSRPENAASLEPLVNILEQNFAELFEKYARNVKLIN